jgi:hypothetical protein
MPESLGVVGLAYGNRFPVWGARRITKCLAHIDEHSSIDDLAMESCKLGRILNLLESIECIIMAHIYLQVWVFN